jgi:hypothetical protein
LLTIAVMFLVLQALTSRVEFDVGSGYCVPVQLKPQGYELALVSTDLDVTPPS